MLKERTRFQDEVMFLAETTDNYPKVSWGEQPTSAATQASSTWPLQIAHPFNRALFIGVTNDWFNLPYETTSNARREVFRIFNFIGQAQKKKPMIVISTSAPYHKTLPTTYDFSNSFVSVINGVPKAYVDSAFDLQKMYVNIYLRDHGLPLLSTVRTHVPSSSETIGYGGHMKEVRTSGSQQLAVSIMAGAVNIPDVITSFRDNVDNIILKRIQEKDNDRQIRDPGKWHREAKELLGKGLGRAIAHEARHQYMKQHAGDGLGKASAYLFGEPSSEQFSSKDQKDILNRIKQLEANQAAASLVIPTWPSGGGFRNANPFPF
jgi:hypothetical protein